MADHTITVSIPAAIDEDILAFNAAAVAQTPDQYLVTTLTAEIARLRAAMLERIDEASRADNVKARAIAKVIMGQAVTYTP